MRQCLAVVVTVVDALLNHLLPQLVARLPFSYSSSAKHLFLANYLIFAAIHPSIDFFGMAKRNAHLLLCLLVLRFWIPQLQLATARGAQFNK